MPLHRVIASGAQGARSQPLSNLMRGLLNWHKPKLQGQRDASTCTEMEVAVTSSQSKSWCHWLFLILSYKPAQLFANWPDGLCLLLLYCQSLAAIVQSVKAKTRLILSRWLPWRGEQQNNPSLLLSSNLHLRCLLKQQPRCL